MLEIEQPARADEVHIAGLIVHAVPAAVGVVKANLAVLPRALVHAAGEDGRMIVTIEAGSTKQTLDIIDAIRALDGVVSVAMVYQHAEDSQAMNEEVR